MLFYLLNGEIIYLPEVSTLAEASKIFVQESVFPGIDESKIKFTKKIKTDENNEKEKEPEYFVHVEVYSVSVKIPSGKDCLWDSWMSKCVNQSILKILVSDSNRLYSPEYAALWRNPDPIEIGRAHV